MKLAGISLLVASAVLVAIGLGVPLLLFATVASAETPSRPEEFPAIALIPLICLPAAVVAGIAGLALLIGGWCVRIVRNRGSAGKPNPALRR